MKKFFGFVALLALAAACNPQEMGEVTSGKAISFAMQVDNAIGQSTTKAGEADSNPYATGYHALPAGAEVHLSIQGTWVGHTPTDVVWKCIGTADADSNNDNINDLSFGAAEQPYWDIFGVADPNNTQGRQKGVSVYGAAVNYAGEPAPAFTDNDVWQDISWDVYYDGNDVFKRDLLITNNIDYRKSTAYRYDDDLETDPYKNLIIFKHAMSMVTVHIIAGEGFTRGQIGATTNKFETYPTFTLTNSKSKSDLSGAYAFTGGTVGITDGDIDENVDSRKVVETQMVDDRNPDYTVIRQALIFPHSPLGMGYTDEADDQVVAILTADGNNYFITAKEMRAAMKEVHEAEFPSNYYLTRPGYNYIFTIRVDKSGIKLQATVEDWKVVKAENVKAQIMFDADVVEVSGASGTPVTVDGSSFDLYQLIGSNTSKKNSDYGDKTTTSTLTTPEQGGDASWVNNPEICWPNGTDNFYFRALADFDATNNTIKTQGASQNVTLTQNGTDIMWGTSAAHTGTEADGTTTRDYTEGQAINPRTGKVPMVFYHAMTKVTVNLETSTTADKVDLTDATIAISPLYTSATLNIDNGSCTYSGDRTADAISGLYAANDATKDSGKFSEYLVVPQELANDVMVTITLKDGTKYSTQLNLCKPDGSTTAIDEWESGTHYTYTFTLLKAALYVTATLSNWTNVNSSSTIWF